MGLHKGLGTAILVAGLMACGGGGDDEPAPSTTGGPVTTASNPAADSFKAADDAYGNAFDDASIEISEARKAANLAGAQAGGRKIRDALFTYDAELRKIAFSPPVAPKSGALLTAISGAIAAFDEQNTAADKAAYQAVDAKTGPAVRAVEVARGELRSALGIAAPFSGPPTTSAGAISTAVSSKQGVLDRPYLSKGAVDDAAAWQADLLSVGAANADPANKASDSLGIVEAWTGAFPFLKASGLVVGSSVEAPASGISGFTVYAKNDKEPASATNPVYLAFALKDAAGTCAAGVLSGFPAPTTPQKLTLPPGPCTGAAAAKAGGF